MRLRKGLFPFQNHNSMILCNNIDYVLKDNTLAIKNLFPPYRKYLATMFI